MADVKIKALKNGPLLVTGVVDIQDAEGKTVLPSKPNIALCRCGHSNNKPFCDGSHAKAGFQG